MTRLPGSVPIITLKANPGGRGLQKKKEKRNMQKNNCMERKFSKSHITMSHI